MSVLTSWVFLVNTPRIAVLLTTSKEKYTRTAHQHATIYWTSVASVLGDWWLCGFLFFPSYPFFNRRTFVWKMRIKYTDAIQLDRALGSSVGAPGSPWSIMCITYKWRREVHCFVPCYQAAPFYFVYFFPKASKSICSKFHTTLCGFPPSFFYDV
jgi:hypothetical protein